MATVAVLGAGLAAAGSTVAGAAPVSARTPQPVAGAVPPALAAALAGLPRVPLSVTDGFSEQALYRQAIALVSASVTRASSPLREDLAATQQTTEAAAVTAARDDDDAAAAGARATRAASAARASARQYTALAATVRATAVRLYMSGGVPTPSRLDVGSADELMDAQDYLDTAVGPDALLEDRQAALDASRAEATASARAAAQARTAARQAGAALSAERAAGRRLEGQLAGVAPATAGAVTADHRALAAQAATELTSATALQFKPAVPLPAPLATTAVALTWAFAELGKPYLWGGTGPDSFDCSGLTQYAWNKAGVAIPRVAADQDAFTDPVPLSQLLPGDLVFYGTTYIHHVGMYIGDGLMINAPHTGTVVQVSPIWWSDLAGFGRVHALGTPTASHDLPTAARPAPRLVRSTAPVPSEVKPPAPAHRAPGRKLAHRPSGGFSVGAPTSTTTTTVPPAPTTTTTQPAPTTTTTTVPPTTTTTTTVPPATTTTTGILGL